MLDEPMWFLFMRNCRWTVRAIAQHIQHTFPSLRECREIASAAEALTSQVGH